MKKLYSYLTIALCIALIAVPTFAAPAAAPAATTTPAATAPAVAAQPSMVAASAADVATLAAVDATSGYTNTNTRGNVTVVGGTATTGTICTVNFSTTLSAAPGTCVVTESDGGAALFNLSHGVPSTTAFTVSAGLTVAAATVAFDYVCTP